jgi:hypothetical protein
VVGAQARLAPAARRPITVLVDEFQSMPGADYETILSELAKYGANLVLATQSLARLDALDREHQRALKATVFANIDALFAFHTSAEDARYLVHELDEEQVSEQDLVSLGEHRCYARLSAGPERLEVFSVELDAPPPDDPARRDRLVADSADRYGRDRAAVDAALQQALDRVRASRGSRAAEATREDETAGGPDGRGAAGEAGGPGDEATAPPQPPTVPPSVDGAAAGAASTDRPAAPDRGLPRNWRRNRRNVPSGGAEQTSFIDAEGRPRPADGLGDAAG